MAWFEVESSWNVMAHGDTREGKWRGDWRMEWVASTLHTTAEHGIFSITTADAHTSAANIRLNWRPRRFKWARPFRRKMKFGVCACAITLHTQSTTSSYARRDGTKPVPQVAGLSKKSRPNTTCPLLLSEGSEGVKWMGYLSLVKDLFYPSVRHTMVQHQ